MSQLFGLAERFLAHRGIVANILVYVETIDERADPACLDVLASMREAASRLGATLYAVMPTVEPPVYGEDDIVATISRQGADKVILLSHPSLSAPASFDSHGAAVLAAAHRLPPSLLVFADTPGCRDVALGCSAALSAPLLVHPHIDIDRHPWPALVMSRFHDEVRTFSLAEMDRPLVVVAAPGRGPLPPADCSDDAEVVVLSPKTTLRRMSARPVETPAVPPRGSDLLLAGENLTPADQASLFRLGKNLGADLLTFGPDGGPSAPGSGAAHSSRQETPWAKTVIFFGDSSSSRLCPDPSASADLLWISQKGADLSFHTEARVEKQTSDILERLVEKVSEPSDQEPPPAPTPLHFRKAGKRESFDGRRDDTQDEQPAKVVVLLAGPDPTERGPGIDVLLDFLQPAVDAALDLPAHERVAICCGHEEADRLLEILGQRPFDRLIRVVPPLPGPLATSGLARILAASVRKLDADLVVAADRGGHWHRGITGPAVARALDWPFITKALGPFNLTRAGLAAHRQAWLTTWTWQIEMPAVLCVARSNVTQAQAHVRSSVPDISLWTMDDIGLQKEDVVPLCRPMGRVHRQKRTTEKLSSAQDILTWLTKRRLPR